ncbi:SDR family oxidoreductase [Lysobacter sp. 2RAF19]
MDLDLTGKHALVCGASEGIGRAAARELALLGADVTLLARRADVLETLANELPRKDGQQHGWISADVLETDRLHAQAQALCAGKPVHILVNNTGGPPGGQLNTAQSDAFERAFRQHLLANQALVQAVLPGMRAARFGRIVNVISTSVKEPIAGLGVSNTIRGAVANWSKTLATEIGGDGITVNNVLPGYTRTQRLDQILGDRAKATGQTEEAIARGMLATVPAARFADAAELGAVIAFLCAPAAGYINGVNLPVDGGRTKSL